MNRKVLNLQIVFEFLFLLVLRSNQQKGVSREPTTTKSKLNKIFVAIYLFLSLVNFPTHITLFHVP